MTQIKAHPTKIRLPALGKSFSLGQLYDCRSGVVIRGTSLWSSDVTSKAFTTHINKNSVYDVLTDITLESKIKLLGIDNDLKGSILKELVPLSGASQYLNDQECSTKHDEVALHYSCTTKTEQLDIEKLSKEEILCPDLFTNRIGTHVVCGLLYGGQAFFVFNSRPSTGHRISSTSLYEAVKALPNIEFKSGRLDMSQEMYEKTAGIGCRLYSDISFPYYPTGYKDAAKVLDGFQQAMEGSGAVPIEVLLWPLSEIYYFTLGAVLETNTFMKNVLLANSQKIKSGYPSIYSLELHDTLEKPNDQIRKCELGQSCDGMTEKVIMIVGATGAGKTTLINGLANYVLGVYWEDKFRFQLIADIEESKQSSQAESQTKWITSYTLHYRKGFNVKYSLTVIDTPGFGDISGIKRDKEITQQMHSFFTTQGEEGIDHIDAIGFVTPASLPRLTPTQRFIFDQVLEIFGRDISENIFLLVTFADDQKPAVLEGVKVAEIPYKTYFKFNNSALYAENGTTNLEIQDCGFDKRSWEMSEKSFRRFFKNLEQTEVKSIILTKSVLNERQCLETHVTDIHQHLRNGLNKLEQLRIEVDVLKRHETDIELNKEFTYEVTEEKVRTDDIPSGTYISNCLTCKRTCHYPCYIDNDDMKSDCAVMTGGRCVICPDKCMWNFHKNMSYKFVIELVTKEMTALDLKNRYDTGRDKLTAEYLIVKVIDDFKSEQITVMYYIEQVKYNMRRLNEIALKPNPLSTVGYIDTLIKSEESQLLPGWENRRQQLSEVKEQAEILRLTLPGYVLLEKSKEEYVATVKKYLKENGERKFSHVVKKSN